MNPQTREVMAYIDHLIQEIKDNWASCDFQSSKMEETSLKNAFALGKLQGLAEMMALDFETINNQE